MVNYFKQISTRIEKTKLTGSVEAEHLTLHKGADLNPHNVGITASTQELKFLGKIIRMIRETLLGKKRQKNELAKIIAQAFGFDNTRIYVKGEKDSCYLLGEYSSGTFRTRSTYENGSAGKNKIFHALEEMANEGEFILRFDLRYALFLWEDDPEARTLIKDLGLKRDEKQIELLRQLAPSKDDVIADINYYLIHNMYLKKLGLDVKQISLETIFIALVNGENKVHGYIMANNFITGRLIEVDEELLKGISEIILDTYKIYKSMEEEKDKATAAERELMVQNMQLEQIAIRDGLTGLFTKRYFQEIFPNELERAKREGNNVGLIFIDIDHFKHVNDTYRHEVGDRVLAKVAEIIKEECRKMDIPCRFGGEEIVIISSAIDNVEQIIALARRIRNRVNNYEFTAEPESAGKQPRKFKITLSFGLKIGIDYSILGEADQAMYHSKKHDRDKIVIKDPEKAKMQPLNLPIPDEDRDHIVFIE